MRRFYALLILLLLSHPFGAQAGIDDMGAKGYRLLKNRSIYDGGTDRTYHLLFYTRSANNTNGKFLLVDADLNILAETPSAYNLHTFCPHMNACYFMSYAFGFLAKHVWQLDINTPVENARLIDLYGAGLDNKQAEEDLLRKFLQNRTAREFAISAPSGKFTRAGSYGGIQNAPSWMRYISPFLLISAPFLAVFILFLFLRHTTVKWVNRRPEPDNRFKTTLRRAQMLLSLVTVCCGLALCIGVAMEAPGGYAFLLLAYFLVHGFSFKKKTDGKNAAAPPKKTAV